MPIVFIHGVNNRDGSEYRDNVRARDALIKELVVPELGLDPKKVRIFNPYWGDAGISFRWDLAVVPTPTKKYESFGAGDPSDNYQAIQLAAQQAGAKSIVEIARKDLAAAVDLVFAAGIAAADSDKAASEIARRYRAAMAYARKNPKPAWLDAVTDDNFVDQLDAEASQQGVESFGIGIMDSLKEGVTRLKNALPSAATDLAARLWRKDLTESLARFTGDVFQYLKFRGDKDKRGDIPDRVLKALHEAAEAKQPGDDKLIVIAHSFGGEIIYDILTHFDTDLEVNVLITVGSQVGLFEEMKMFHASSEAIGGKDIGKVPRPANLKRWLNVFDTNDFVSYQAEPVFDKVQDYAYDTGFGGRTAHSGYFLQPSFYDRLAARLKQP